MGVSLRNFRWTLVNDFILPFKDNRKQLKLPPIDYPNITRHIGKHL